MPLRAAAHTVIDAVWRIKLPSHSHETAGEVTRFSQARCVTLAQAPTRRRAILSVLAWRID